MSGPEWHFEPDGDGGFFAHNVGIDRRRANAWRGYGFLLGILAVYLVIAMIVQFVIPFLAANQAYIQYIILPAFALVGLFPYPVVKIADRIRGVRHLDHRFLRRWFIASIVLLIVTVGPLFLLLAILLVHFALHPHLLTPLFHLVSQKIQQW